MLKRDLRLFSASFCITLILAGWVTAFLVVDNSSSRFESAAAVPALVMERAGPLDVDVALLGQWYTVTLEPLNEFEAFRKQHACLMTPRRLLTLEKLYSLAVYGRKALHSWYKEQEYIQNVLNSEGEVPVE